MKYNFFCSKLHNYITTISKLEAVWLTHSEGTEAVFWGKVHWSLAQNCWPLLWFIFITNTKWVKVFCRWQTFFFGQKCDEESGGRAGGQTGGQTVTTLLLFGHVTLLCGKFLSIKLNKGPVQLSDSPIEAPSIPESGSSVHTGLVLLILAPAADRHISAEKGNWH